MSNASTSIWNTVLSINALAVVGFIVISVLSDGMRIKNKKSRRSKLIACEPNPTPSLVLLGPHSVYVCCFFVVGAFSLMGTNWQHLQIRKSYKNPDFQRLLKNQKLEACFCLVNISKSQGLTSSKGLDVFIPLYGVETNVEAGGPRSQ